MSLISALLLQATNAAPNPDLSQLAEDVAAIRARLAEQVPGEAPVVVIPTPDDPAQIAVIGVTRTASGAPEGGVEVVFRLNSTATPGIYDREIKAVSSVELATLGQVSVLLLRSAKYEAKRGNGTPRHFTTPDDDSFELPSFIAA